MALLLFNYTFLMSQSNGGQLNENNSLKIEYLGYNSNAHIFKISNKQPCSVKVEYKIESGTSLYVTISGNSGTNIIVPGNKYDTYEVKARSEEICHDFRGDKGWVEAQTQFILPLKFDYLKVEVLSKNTIIVYFKVYDTDSDKQSKFNIQVSTDGKNFRTVAVENYDPIIKNKDYVVKIKL